MRQFTRIQKFEEKKSTERFTTRERKEKISNQIRDSVYITVTDSGL